MSERQKAREQRKEAFWSAKYASARTARQRLLVAFDEIHAAVADLPAAQQDERSDQVVAHLRVIAKQVTESQVHAGKFTAPKTRSAVPTRPGATRARARREV